MKVLVSTARTQGSTPGDYHHAVTGELVAIPHEDCDNPRCGCSRGFAGLASHRATTTAEIAELPVELGLVRTAIGDALARQGWLTGLDADEVEEELDVHLDRLALVCDTFAVGTVVRRRGDSVWAHPEPA